jgi:hypothetical protein
MADTKETGEQEQINETVLIAHVTVHLKSGDSFELLPFEDTSDVKSRVSDLMGDWFKSGFLIRGARIYPWHQVKLVEATEVAELSKRESEQRFEQWEALDPAHLQQSFWKTKQMREKKSDGDVKQESH